MDEELIAASLLLYFLVPSPRIEDVYNVFNVKSY